MKTPSEEIVSKAAKQAKRYNQDKPDLHYLHTWYDALCEVARVSMAGAEKYERGNYLLGQPYSQLLGCAERHVGKFGDFRRPDYDIEPDANGKPGTGRHHIALAIWNLLQLLQHEVGQGDGKKWDNRLKPPRNACVEVYNQIMHGDDDSRGPEDLRPLKVQFVVDQPATLGPPPVSFHPSKWTPQQRNRYPRLFDLLCRQSNWALGDESPVVHPFTGNPDDYEQATEDMEAAAKKPEKPEPWLGVQQAWLDARIDDLIEVTHLGDQHPRFIRRGPLPFNCRT